MTRNIGTDANINRIRLAQQTSHPASPASGYNYLYIISGSAYGGLYLEDSSGRQIGPFITGSSGGAGITLISEQTLSADTNNITFSNIPGTYRHLMLKFVGRNTTAGTSPVELRLQLNGDTGNNYDLQRSYLNQNSYAGVQQVGTAFLSVGYLVPAGGTSGFVSEAEINFLYYRQAPFNKTVDSRISYFITATAADIAIQDARGQWRNTSPITSIKIYPATDNLVSGTIASLYGIS